MLVHDALYEPDVDRLVARLPNAPALKKSMTSHHTTAEDAGRVAQADGVTMLVLSHLVPLTIRLSPIRCGSTRYALTSKDR